VQAFDVCGACGGGNPSVVWSDITNWATLGNPGTAIWLRPESVSGGGPTPQPPVTPQPQPPAVNLQPVLDALAVLTAKVDAIAAVSTEARDIASAARDLAHQANANASDIKHVELPKVLEQLKQPVTVPCMKGSVYGRGVRFCPE
jgi:hypothetical protein